VLRWSGPGTEAARKQPLFPLFCLSFLPPLKEISTHHLLGNLGPKKVRRMRRCFLVEAATYPEGALRFRPPLLPLSVAQGGGIRGLERLAHLDQEAVDGIVMPFLPLFFLTSTDVPFRAPYRKRVTDKTEGYQSNARKAEFVTTGHRIVLLSPLLPFFPPHSESGSVDRPPKGGHHLALGTGEAFRHPA